MMELAFYAVVAMFIVARLYTSLGSSADVNYHASPINKNSKVIDVDEVEEDTEDIKDYVQPECFSEVETSIESIKEYKPMFSLKKFIVGSEKAFDFIIQAINSHDEASLKKLLDKEFLKKVKARMSATKEAGLQNKTIIVCIKSAKITAATLENTNHVTMSVRFISDQISYSIDQDDKVLDGDEKAIIAVEDNWKFKKDLKSSSPNWLLTGIN